MQQRNDNFAAVDVKVGDTLSITINFKPNPTCSANLTLTINTNNFYGLNFDLMVVNLNLVK